MSYVPSKIKHRGFMEVSPEFRKWKHEIVLPQRSTIDSAGYDFYLMQDIYLNPDECVLTFIDVKAYMKHDEVLKIYIRSSVAYRKNVILANNVGIIDADYFSNPDNDGNIGMLLYNIGTKVQTFKKGDKIAQGIFQKYLITDDDEVSSKRIGGCGSTGK